MVVAAGAQQMSAFLDYLGRCLADMDVSNPQTFARAARMLRGLSNVGPVLPQLLPK